MANEDDWQLIAAYERYLTSGEEADFWAWDELRLLVQRDPAHAWRVIKALLEEVDPARLDVVGAGPLEQLLGAVADQLDDGSDELLRAIEDFAVTSEKARRALAVVYPDERDPRELWDRIDAILGSSVHDRHRVRGQKPNEQGRPTE